MDDVSWPYVVIFFLCLFLSGVFSMCETAFLSLQRTRMKHLEKTGVAQADGAFVKGDAAGERPAALVHGRCALDGDVLPRGWCPGLQHDDALPRHVAGLQHNGIILAAPKVEGAGGEEIVFRPKAQRRAGTQAQTETFAPSPASPRLNVLPSPDAPPVTTHTLSFNRIFSSYNNEKINLNP